MCLPQWVRNQATGRGLEQVCGLSGKPSTDVTRGDTRYLCTVFPAHRNEEVSAELLEDSTISVVWDEAENRMHSRGMEAVRSLNTLNRSEKKVLA